MDNLDTCLEVILVFFLKDLRENRAMSFKERGKEAGSYKFDITWKR